VNMINGIQMGYYDIDEVNINYIYIEFYAK